jgi:hypothetical protein
MKNVSTNKNMSEIAGEIYIDIGIEEFAIMFANNGIRVKLGDSCQYEGGTYIRVEEGATDFIIAKTGGEYVVMGHASLDLMYQTSRRISLLLITLDIRHAFEVYNKSMEIVYYFHHNCPQQE